MLRQAAKAVFLILFCILLVEQRWVSLLVVLGAVRYVQLHRESLAVWLGTTLELQQDRLREWSTRLEQITLIWRALIIRNDSLMGVIHRMYEVLSY